MKTIQQAFDKYIGRNRPAYVDKGLPAFADVARIVHATGGIVSAAHLRYRATLDVLERSKFSDPPTIGEIAVACAISYVEFRIPDLDWKPSRPQLAAWYDRFCEFPSMKATVPAQP